jgi:hypothetical protein
VVKQRIEEKLRGNYEIDDEYLVFTRCIHGKSRTDVRFNAEIH